VVHADIGTESPNTPVDVLLRMSHLAKWLQQRGFNLRSQLANDAERAFLRGITWLSSVEIYTTTEPTTEDRLRAGAYRTLAKDDVEKAENVVAALDGDTDDDSLPRINRAGVYALLGRDLRSPVDFVVYWASGSESLDMLVGRTTGRICRERRLPCWNLRWPD
jgi:hypothetical protein